MKRLWRIASLLLASSLAACQTPGFDDRTLRTATPEASDVAIIAVKPITAASLQVAHSTEPAQLPLASLADAYEYRVDAGDVLSVLVWDHPELSDIERTFDDRPSSLAPGSGRTVSADGSLYFPYVGYVQVAGHTTREIRALLEKGLSSYLRAPQLEVRISAYRSRRILVGGAVRSPGIVTLGEMQLSILDVLAQAGGTLADADLTAVTLSRDGHVYELNLAPLLAERSDATGIAVQPGDLVTVPDSAAKRIHVLGEVLRSGSYPMHNGRMSLADALGAGGGFNPAAANPGRIYVFRQEQGAVVANWLDAASPAAMALAADYPLQPRDVVYVAPVSFTRYNRALGQLLPTLQALWQTAITSRELR